MHTNTFSLCSKYITATFNNIVNKIYLVTFLFKFGDALKN